MAQETDQIFVLLTGWILSYLPEWLRPYGLAVLGVVGVLAVYVTLFALTTWFERKGLARMQNRYGPNRVGPFGLFQPIADGVKALVKEDVVPFRADQVLHFLAPLILLIAVCMELGVVPVGRNMVLVDMDAGLLFFFAMGASTELSVFMAGWSSRNKYSLLGAMRAIAQMISYEIPLLLSAVAAVMIAGTLSLPKIVEAQSGFTDMLPHWYVFTPWGFAGALIFGIAASAETNRCPFDLPEGESELVAGYFTEYSGFKFAIFFIAEYIGMFSISSISVTLFFGGWGAPLSFLSFIPSWIWFFAKVMTMIFVFIWVRGTLPRLRQDQLMNFAWKFMLPLSLVNLGVTALWRFMNDDWQRWAACTAILVVSYVVLGLTGMRSQHVAPRKYRYAE
jgi:NADH-quinone oxidoreductase subunit H